MANVYSNSLLTIALARTTSPYESCLDGPSHNKMLPFEVKTPGFLDDREIHPTDTCVVIPQDYFLDGLHYQPLGLRAWALQERLFSPRSLSFGLGELFWECSHIEIASELFPSGLSRRLKISRHVQKDIPNTSDIGMLHSIWSNFVQNFTDRELTYPETDKLVALSAVANRIAMAMDDTYIAGHFWKMLPFDLNWTLWIPQTQKPVKGKKYISRRMEAPSWAESEGLRYKTPSWSWASINVPVLPAMRDSTGVKTLLATASSYTMTPIDFANPEGQVPSATLVVEALYAEFQWMDGVPSISSGDIIDYWLEIEMDSFNCKPTNGEMNLIIALAEDMTSLYWEGLVLAEVDQRGEKVYERVGNFRYHCKSPRLTFNQKKTLTLV